MTSATIDRRIGLSGGAAIKVPARCATTAPITLSGFQTVDAVALTSGDGNLRVLVKNQANAIDNGLYDASSGAWTRCIDADGTEDLVEGTIVLVLDGTQHGQYWQVDTDDPVQPGTNAITFIPALTSALLGLGLNDFLPSNMTPTYVSSTQFTVTGNQTTIFAVQRRLQVTVTAGVITGTVQASSFGAGETTITASWDSGQLDSGLSIVQYGFLNATPLSIPFIFPFSKMRSAEYYGARGQVGFDNSNAFQNALDNTGTFSLDFINPAIPYEFTVPLIVRRPAIRLHSDTRGLISAYTTQVKYTGVATSSPMIYVQNNMHGFCCEGFNLNANSLARSCIHVDVADGDSTHFPKFHDLFLQGYTSRGMILGKDSVSVLGTGQLSMVDMQRIWWIGGTAGAVALAQNAQNCEFNVANCLNFTPTIGNEHSHHIIAYAGGLNIHGMATTGATDYPVLVQGSQFNIYGWRNEDRLGLQCTAVGLEGPCVLNGFLSRGSTTLAGDIVVDFSASGNSTLQMFAQMKGSVQIGNSAALGIDCAVMFTNGGDFILPGPIQWKGRALNLSTGENHEMGGAGGFGVGPITTGIVAHSGGGQGSAVALTGRVNLVDTCAADHDSTKLPVILNGGITAQDVFVRNDTAHIVDIYPVSGGSINSLGTNNPYSLAAGASVRFIPVSSTVWVV